jgi:hypothetical protein
MTRFSIRLLTLACFAVALAAVPMVGPAKAAADGTTTVKKKHTKIHPAGQMQAPAASQYPRNMSEDPGRKAGGGY